MDIRKLLKKASERRELTLVVMLVVLLVVVGVINPKFFTDSLSLMANDMAILIIVSIAQFFAILCGGIDLSVGSIIAFSGMSCSMLNQYHPEIPMIALIFISLAIGAALGAVNGVLIAYGKIPPIITTLGTVNIYRGMTFLLSGNTWVTAHEMSQAYKTFAKVHVLGFTRVVWAAVIIVVAAYIFMRYTRTGRAMYAIGGNANAAKFVGVSEEKTRFITFVASGLLCGLAGLLWTTHYANAVNELAQGFEMNAVASCVLGGVNFAGGAGGIPGVVLGSLFFGILNNALPSIYIDSLWQMFVQGAVVLVALVANTVSDNNKEKKLLSQRRVRK